MRNKGSKLPQSLDFGTKKEAVAASVKWRTGLLCESAALHPSVWAGRDAQEKEVRIIVLIFDNPPPNRLHTAEQKSKKNEKKIKHPKMLRVGEELQPASTREH